jgi:hypothetical protein
MIHVTNRPHIHMRLGPLKLAFRHHALPDRQPLGQL